MCYFHSTAWEANCAPDSESCSSNPTDTLPKRPINGSPEGSAKSNSPENGKSLSRVDLPASKFKSSVPESNSGNTKITSSPKISRNQIAPVSSDPRDLQRKQSISELCNKAEAIQSAEAKLPDTSNPSLSNAGVSSKSSCSNIALGDTLETHFLEKPKVAQHFLPSIDSGASTEITQNRNTSSKNKRKSRKMSKGGSSEISTPVLVPSVYGSAIEGCARRSFEAGLELRLTTGSSTMSSSIASCQDAQSITEKSGRESDSSPNGNTRGMSILPNGHTRQNLSLGKRLSQSKIDASHDVFNVSTPRATHNRQKSDISSKAKFETNSPIKSSGRKPGSATNKSKSQPRGESPAPKRGSQSKSRRKPSEKKADHFDGKENMQLPPPPKLLLSDLSQWPALGSSKADTDVKPPKPLGDCTPKPGPIRRDSMASVVSSTSPQPVRRLT